MMERKKIIKYSLMVLCIFVLSIIPWASVFGITSEGVVNSIEIFQRFAFFAIGTSSLMIIYNHFFAKPLKQEMKEEGIKEADQKDTKQRLLKPPTGIAIFFLVLILLGIGGFIIQVIFPVDHQANWSLGIFCFLFMTGLSLFLWYSVPVFIFGEDSVQIKPYLFYVFGGDRKAIFRYEDITSVGPDPKFEGNRYGYDRRYRILITTNGTTQAYGLTSYDRDLIAKLYLRFQEKLGDKVSLE